MSAISELEAIFKNIHSKGTFNFTSEARQDQFMRNIDLANFPLMLIVDDITTTAEIQPGSNAQESPNLQILFLTKFDTDNNPIEYDSTRTFQETEAVEPMKQLAFDVIGRYVRDNDNVWRIAGENPTITIIDQYDIWSKGLYGVEATFAQPRRRTIDYCAV
jgi:hypothetical protein